MYLKLISYLSYRYGSILIDCKNLTETIDQEIKQWISVYGRAMQIKYKREMDFIVAQVFTCVPVKKQQQRIQYFQTHLLYVSCYFLLCRWVTLTAN